MMLKLFETNLDKLIDHTLKNIIYYNFRYSKIAQKHRNNDQIDMRFVYIARGPEKKQTVY